MSEILLVNPRRRKRSTKRRRTTVRKRRRNPVAANPRRRRRRSTTVRRRRRRSNPRMRINVRTIQSQVMNAIPGAFGAMGLDIIMGYMTFIPAQWRTGIPGYLTKAVGAIGMGMVAQNFVRPATAKALTEGALTVMMYGVVRNMTAQFMPQLVPAGGMAAYIGPGYDNGMGYYGSGWNPNVDDPDAMGTYLPELSTEGVDTDESGFGAYIDDMEYA